MTVFSQLFWVLFWLSIFCIAAAILFFYLKKKKRKKHQNNVLDVSRMRIVCIVHWVRARDYSDWRALWRRRRCRRRWHRRQWWFKTNIRRPRNTIEIEKNKKIHSQICRKLRSLNTSLQPFSMYDSIFAPEENPFTRFSHENKKQFTLNYGCFSFRECGDTSMFIYLVVLVNVLFVVVDRQAMCERDSLYARLMWSVFVVGFLYLP